MKKRSLVHRPETKRPKGGPKRQSIEQALKNKIPPKQDFISDGDFVRGVISTGSTLLDLAISSNRIYGGGIPAGVILELFGPSSSGKTAILAEVGASAKQKGGCIVYDDPEARLDMAYAARCGLHLSEHEYNRPDTVDELEKLILKWEPKPKNKKAICVRCEDSLAAFSTIAELEKEHKMAAAKRAQAYHQLFRRLGRMINKNGWIIVCSNQEQVQFDTGSRTTPGGNAIKYWASIRIRLFKAPRMSEIKKTWTLKKGSTVEKVIGIRSHAKIIKNSCDDPFREVPIFIIFGRGVDDIRGNLQWYKDTQGLDHYDCVNDKYRLIDPAIKYIEENDLESDLREKVIALYNEIENHFKVERKPKKRF